MLTRRQALLLTLALKAALIALLLFAVARTDLPQFAGKAMGARAATYPIAALAVPVGWWLLRRRRPVSFPFDLDILLILPFLIDTTGNAANLYDTIDVWDDVNHFVNWAILVAAFSRILVRLPLNRLAVATLGVGLGAVTAILWELLEYVSFIRNSPELETAYIDTLGDLVLGLGGSLFAAVLTVTLFWPAPGREHRRASADHPKPGKPSSSVGHNPPPSSLGASR